MLYGKLPIVFLSAIAAEKRGSINSTIATYILGNLDQMKNIGIKEMAENCNVAPSSISRFCKEIGLNGFVELKDLLQSTEFDYTGFSEDISIDKRIHTLGEHIKTSIDMVEDSIATSKLIQLTKDIQQYDEVAVFGLLKAQTAAIILQSDLLMFRKQIYTNISYAEQINYIVNADSSHLIILFTYTGSYFDYDNQRNILKGKDIPKIWMVTGQQKEYPKFISDTLTFSSRQDYASHPYQLDYVASLIGQEYAQMQKQ